MILSAMRRLAAWMRRSPSAPMAASIRVRHALLWFSPLPSPPAIILAHFLQPSVCPWRAKSLRRRATAKEPDGEGPAGAREPLDPE